MIRFLRNIRLDLFSFLAGFISATVIWWLFGYLRPSLKKLWGRIYRGIQAARQGIQAGAEYRHRADTLKYVQGIHLAAPLFSLDEILIPPRLYAPPPVFNPDLPPPFEDVASMVIPYTPDWPELSAALGVNTISPIEALLEGANIAIVGPPGSGKTTALVYIASQLARHAPEMGSLQNHIPVFIHISDLDLPPKKPDAPIETLIEAVSNRASTLSQTRMPEMLRTKFELGNALLLLDGLDELAPQPLQDAISFLDSVTKTYPENQIVVTASTNHIQNLPAMGFAPIGMAIWGRNEQAQFIQQWRELWDLFVVDHLDTETYVDPILLNGWLLKLEHAATPLEFTLKVWAAYAGDVRGGRGEDAIEAYIRRMSVSIPKARPTLELLASQILLTMRSVLSEKDIQQWIAGTSGDLTASEFNRSASDEAETSPKNITIPRVLPDLNQSGLLVGRNNQKIGFNHPVIAGYLAGQALGKQESDRIFTQPSWLMKELSSYYFMAANADSGYHIHQLLNTADGPLCQNALTTGHWLQMLPKSSPYRKPILQKLSTMLQNKNFPMGLRMRILNALATSGDPGVVSLFRHLLNSEQNENRQLGALGCGYLRDVDSTKALINTLLDFPIIAQAACLALTNIGTKPALEAVTDILLNGDEQVRRAAAEAFANHPAEGYPLLKDGCTVDDLLVRRAVIYGLQKVRQPWATQILENLQIEDAQWVVKDAASQAVEFLNATNPSVPLPLTPLEDIPWLVAFASEKGMGVSAGDSAREMLLRVLREGTEDQKLAAMSQIQRRGEAGIFPTIYHYLYGENSELSEAAYHTIWQISTTGTEIPPPNQFGLGAVH